MRNCFKKNKNSSNLSSMNEKFELTHDQRYHLQRSHRKQRDARLADRIKCILLLDKGWSPSQIQEVLLMDSETIRRHKNAFLSGGLQDLLQLHYKGRIPKLSPKQVCFLSKHLHVKHYSTAASITDFIKKKWDINLSSKGVTNLLHRIGFSYRKPKKIPQNIDKQTQKEFVDSLQEEKGVVLFVDAVHPQHNSKPSHGWFPKSKKVGIFSNTGRKRVNLNGALNTETLEVFVSENETIDAFSAVELFERIQRAYPNEDQIVLVCDNASYYRSKLVRKYLENSRLKIKFLPPYSPNLNMIERLWKFMHKKVTNNRFYEKFYSFRRSILRFFQNFKRYRGEIQHLFKKFSYIEKPQIILH